MAALLVVTLGLTAVAQAAECDRSCLIGVADGYLAALVAKKPAAAPFAGTIRMAENAKIIQPGEGFWQDVSGGPTEFRIYVPDPVSRQVGFVGMMTGANGAPVQLALRLKLDEAGKITEAEQLVIRTVRDAALRNLQKVRPGLLESVPPAQRMERAKLLTIGATYYDAVDNNRGADAPFAKDCVRHENGLRTTGNPARPNDPSSIPGSLGCADQLDTNIMAYMGPIERRDVSIADPVTGLAMGWSIIRHPMLEKTYRVFNVPGYEKRTVNFEAFDNFAAHVFKVKDGEIHEIEAVGYVGAGAGLPSPF
jgi:hypothetical protein